LEEDSEEEDGSASEATGLRGWQSCCSSVFAPFTSCVSLSNYVSESVISSTGIVRRHLGRNRLQATPLIPASCFYKACQSSLYSTSQEIAVHHCHFYIELKVTLLNSSCSMGKCAQSQKTWKCSAPETGEGDWRRQRRGLLHSSHAIEYKQFGLLFLISRIGFGAPFGCMLVFSLLFPITFFLAVGYLGGAA